MNPEINPFEIIKASYFQTNDLSKMNTIFNKVKEENENIKKNKNKDEIYMFKTDYFDTLKKFNEELKIDLETDNFPKDFFDATRILYIKITNLIIFNIIYNRLQNKYLLFSIQENCNQYACVKKMVPEKVNELLNKFTISNIQLTNDNILSVVLEGKPIENLNKLILLDKEPLTNDFEEGREDYVFQEVLRKDSVFQEVPRKDSVFQEVLRKNIVFEEGLRNKYLKYKSKYLNLKKLISSKK
jgi:hypothetical protein